MITGLVLGVILGSLIFVLVSRWLYRRAENRAFRDFWGPLVALTLFLSSCTISRTTVDVPGKLHREETLATVGGQGAKQHGADGSSTETYDTTQSFGNAMTAGTTLGAGEIFGSFSKAKEVTKQVASKGATQTALGAQKAGVQTTEIGAKQATTNTAISAGAPLAPVAVNPP